VTFGGKRTADDEEFEWFSAGDAMQNDVDLNGVGDDGGAFGFGADDDFENENEQKEDALDPEDWMTSMIQMDNVLDGSVVKKKDVNKKNTKGKSMAAMAKSSTSNQPIPNSFGSDDFFNQNANGNGDQSNKEDEFDPFGLGNTQNNGSASNNITSLYKNNNAQNNQGNAQSFGYQAKSPMNAYSNDPFAGIGGGVSGPKPAKYVTRKKASDPFAQFGSMK